MCYVSWTPALSYRLNNQHLSVTMTCLRGLTFPYQPTYLFESCNDQLPFVWLLIIRGVATFGHFQILNSCKLLVSNFDRPVQTLGGLLTFVKMVNIDYWPRL